MKIAFVYLCSYNITGIPLGLSYLISILKEKGYDVSLFETTFYDFDYSAFNTSGEARETGEKIIADFRAFVKKERPEVIGVSCSSVGLAFSLKMLESLPNRITSIFGGIGATVDYSNLVNQGVVDYVCVGFGEECLPKLLEYLRGNTNLRDIPNLVYKENGGIVKNNFSQEFDLSGLPIPDWGLFDPRHFKRIFKGRFRRWGSFQLSRGCPFSCTYCVNDYLHQETKMKIDRFPAGKIIEEIKSLSKKFKLDIVKFIDECFGYGKLDYYRNFSDLYRKEVGLPTTIETRPEAITPETIGILKKMNCISVTIGIEAGNITQRTALLNRDISEAQIKSAFDLLHRANIRSSSFNMIGLPEDSRAKIFETIKMNKECGADFMSVFVFSPFPGTGLRDYCRKKDLLETDSVTDYLKESVIRNKGLSHEELSGLLRTFKLYVKFPRPLYPLIRISEKEGRLGNAVLFLLERLCALIYGR